MLKARFQNHITLRRLYLLIIIISLFIFPVCRQKGYSGEETEEIVLNERSRSKIQTLDPGNVGDVPTDEICCEFYECLYTYHFLKRPNQIVPELAVDLPDISEDGMWMLAGKSDENEK